MIKVENLTKHFGTKRAVAGVSFSVERGEILGFLGPNGAGKSTTMRMIAGFIPPTAGCITVNGHDIVESPATAKHLIGYLPENARSYTDMTVFGFLAFCAELRGLCGGEKNKAVHRVIETCFLEPVMHQSTDTLSKDYYHRACLAQSILHDPDILVLDEPTDGLEPNHKHEILQLIRRISKSKAIVFSTHVLEEVEAVCTRAVIVDRGEIIANYTPTRMCPRLPIAGSPSQQTDGLALPHEQSTGRNAYSISESVVALRRLNRWNIQWSADGKLGGCVQDGKESRSINRDSDIKAYIRLFFGDSISHSIPTQARPLGESGARFTIPRLVPEDSRNVEDAESSDTPVFDRLSTLQNLAAVMGNQYLALAAKRDYASACFINDILSTLEAANVRDLRLLPEVSNLGNSDFRVSASQVGTIFQKLATSFLQDNTFQFKSRILRCALQFWIDAQPRFSKKAEKFLNIFGSAWNFANQASHIMEANDELSIDALIQKVIRCNDIAIIPTRLVKLKACAIRWRETLTICYDVSVGPDQRPWIFLHELGHLQLAHSGFHLDYFTAQGESPQETQRRECEEIEADLFAQIFLELLRRNMTERARTIVPRDTAERRPNVGQERLASLSQARALSKRVYAVSENQQGNVACTKKTRNVPCDSSYSGVVSERLRELIFNTNVSIKERAPFGIALDKVGDDRKGVGIGGGGLSEITWSDPLSISEFTSDKTKEPVKSEQPFCISKYPVTVAQYQAFVKDKGYERECLWEDRTNAPGMLDWWKQNGKKGPENYDEVFQTSNHPRVGVCWYEAVAFCRWLAEKLKQDIRLPHENEWEWAARWNGTTADDRHFPWGGDKDAPDLAQKCNCPATGRRHTSTVGLLPELKAKCGALDMSGNVWEWCGNCYTGQNGDRVVREGSWNGDLPSDLSCSNRIHMRPECRLVSLGFRVVCAGAPG